MFRPAPGNFFAVPNPQVPYQGDIPNGLAVGKKIFISGTVRENCERFRVDLEGGNNVLLHFNPRFSQGCVVRNSNFFNSWANEEREGGLPFQLGHRFDLEIAVEADKYVINVNGAKFCDFQHRSSYDEVTHITVDGEIDIENMVFSM